MAPKHFVVDRFGGSEHQWTCRSRQGYVHKYQSPLSIRILAFLTMSVGHTILRIAGRFAALWATLMHNSSFESSKPWQLFFKKKCGSTFKPLFLFSKYPCLHSAYSVRFLSRLYLCLSVKILFYWFMRSLNLITHKDILAVAQ